MHLRILFAVTMFGIACGSSHAVDSSIITLLRPALSDDARVGHEAMLSRGYTPLFNGQDLSGWRNPYPHGTAKVVDGEIHLTDVYRDGIGTDPSSVHANFFPLAFEIVPADQVTGIVDWLSKQPMRCSVYAAQYFLDALFIHGADQKAIDLILAPVLPCVANLSYARGKIPTPLGPIEVD